MNRQLRAMSHPQDAIEGGGSFAIVTRERPLSIAPDWSLAQWRGTPLAASRRQRRQTGQIPSARPPRSYNRAMLCG
jgi:hypothetical protein